MNCTTPANVLATPSLRYAVLGIALLISACRENAAPPAPPPPPTVDVLTVASRDVPVHREWVGTLDGDINATIRPQVTGYLVKQNYREGDLVKKGQVLFEIDQRTFQASVDQAKAVRSQQQALHATAAANLARIKPLAAKNAVSRKDLDDAVGSELSARAALEQASAALETARLNLEFTKIVSPIDGVAGIAKAQIGDLLSPSSQTELTTVSRLDPVKVYFNLSEQEYLRFTRSATTERAEALPLELILADGSVYGEKGRFLLIDRQVDPTTGTFKIGALFPNPRHLLRPGLFGKVRATVGTLTGALLVPQRAVTEIQGRYLIAVVGADNKVELRPVVPGERLGSEWVISSGLKAGEVIVVEGTQKVRPGAPVVPRHPGPARPAPTQAPADAAPPSAAPATPPAEKPAAEPKG